MILNDEQLAHRKLSCVTDSQRDFLDTIADLKRQLAERNAELAAIRQTLDNAFNTGDGTYRP